MRNGKTVPAQMQELISRYNFKKLVSLYNGDKNVKFFTSHNLLRVMLYAPDDSQDKPEGYMRWIKEQDKLLAPSIS